MNVCSRCGRVGQEDGSWLYVDEDLDLLTCGKCTTVADLERSVEQMRRAIARNRNRAADYLLVADRIEERLAWTEDRLASHLSGIEGLEATP